MEQISIAGQVLLPVGATILNIDYVIWNDRAWLSPVYLEHPNGLVRPLRLIAPRVAAGFHVGPSPQILDFFHTIPLTNAILNQGFVPPESAALIEIIENPEVVIVNPPAR